MPDFAVPNEQIVENWPTVKKRWEAFWDQGLYDRPLVQVRAPRAAEESQLESVDPETQWTDNSHVLRRTLESLRRTYYGGEALPWCWNPMSAGYALLFGCQPHFSPATMFVDPAPTGEGAFPTLDGWRDSPWWAWMRYGIERFVDASKGRFFVPVFWGNSAMDILGLVRGVEQFMMDVALNPDWVKSATAAMNRIEWEIFDELLEIASPEAVGLEGTVETCGFWAPGKARTFDADLAYCISGRSFKELILPPMVEWMHAVDYRSWRLDGVGNLTHLETLLDLPELQAIQWVQGDGPNKPIAPWIPLI